MDFKKTLKLFFNIANIPMSLYDEGVLLAEFSNRSFRPDLALHCVKAILEDITTEHVNATFTEDSLICGYIKDKKSNQLLIVGPVSELPCSRKIAYKLLTEMKEPSGRVDELMNYLEQIPCMLLADFLRNLLFLNHLINDEDKTDKYLNEKIESMIGPGMDIHKQKWHPKHNSRDLEIAMLACVEFGKVSELDEILRNHIDTEGNMGTAGNDPLRSFKNVVVSSIAVVARQAAKGGMDYEAALSATDVYLQKLERLRTYESVRALWFQMLFDYTSQVEKIRNLNSHSKLVHKANGYIQNHLYEMVRVADIAAYTGHNISYLCRAFKNDTGKTLSEYINEVKIEEAKRLLISTKKPIVEIAIALGFSSQSYFATVFKSKVGVTPVQYRQS